MIGKHLKDYKKAFKKRCSVKVNSDWKKRWKSLIKYDHDFDGFFIIELVVHKLHIMLDFYEHGKYCMQCTEERLKIVEELKEACKLGDLIVEDEFNEPAYKVMEAHMKTYTTPNNNGTCTLHMDWDTPEDEAEYDRLIKETDAVREKTIDKFFRYVRNHYMNWWD